MKTSPLKPWHIWSASVALLVCLGVVLTIRPPAAPYVDSPSPQARAPVALALSLPVENPAASRPVETPAGGRAMFRLVGATSGQALEPGSADFVRERLAGRKPVGRVTPLAMESLSAFTQVNKGESITIPLTGDESITGVVNLTVARPDGSVTIGGDLAGKVGTFFFDGKAESPIGTVMFPARGIAFRLEQPSPQKVVWREVMLGEVTCANMPKVTEGGARSKGISAAASIIPIFNSRPTASAQIYLDFDGETVTDPGWNSGNTIVAAASSFSAAEIEAIFNRVKEDFAPFDINVTTDVGRFNGAAVRHRVQCIITTTNTAAPAAGGVAKVNSFGTFSYSTPCWSFNPGVIGAAETVSHEVGHTLGLHHDGSTAESPDEYFGGHGVGTGSNPYGRPQVRWGPIMGDPFGADVTQWSKGEYTNATNTEDDVTIITNASNGFGYAPDEESGIGSAQAILAVSGTAINTSGIISRETDDDLYSFKTTGGTFALTASPVDVSPNLDIAIEVRNASTQALMGAPSDPAGTGAASVNINLPNGTYYVKVSGAAYPNPANTGYSKYGSIGAYTLKGTGVFSPPSAPSVSTPFAINITAANATLGGTVVSDNGSGIIERGIVFSATTVNASPVIEDSTATKVIVSGTTGTFSQNVPGLSLNTAYSYRAYATNSQGTSYTSVATFKAVSTVTPFRNGSFETNGGFAVASAAGWTFANGGGVVVANDEGVTDGNTAVIFNAASAAATGMLYQTFSTVPGKGYHVRFDFGAYGPGSFSNSQIQVDVRDGSTPNGGTQTMIPGTAHYYDSYFGNGSTLTVSRSGGSAAIYAPTPSDEFYQYDFEFKAVSGVTTLVFADQSTGGVDNQDALVDNVQVAIADVSDFETPVTGNYEYISGTHQPWTFVGSAGVARNGAFAVSGTSFGQFAFIQRSDTGSSISKTVSFPTPGFYELSYTVASRAGSYDGARYTASIGGQVLRDQTTTSNQAFTPQSASYYASSAGDRTLTFTNISPSGDLTAFIDNVVVRASSTVPVVITPTATSITGTTATLGATVVKDSSYVGSTISARGMVYSVTSVNPDPLLSSNDVIPMSASPATGDFTVPVSSLIPGTSYSFKAYATNSWGTSYSPVGTFTTATLPAVLTTQAATAIGFRNATLNGTVVGNGDTTVWFEYGFNTSYGGILLAVPQNVTGSAPTAVSLPLTSTHLNYHTTYHYRLYAVNSAGISVGNDATFFTNATPTAFAQSGLTTNANTSKAITLTGTDTEFDAITYSIVSPPANGGSVTLAGATGSAATYTPPTNYSGADSFTFRVTDVYGAVSAPATVSLTVSPVLPGAPTIGTATAGNASATVAFNPPAFNGGSAITNYTATSNPGNITGSSLTSPITVPNLVNGTAYTFTVKATNPVGPGAESSPSNAVTPKSNNTLLTSLVPSVGTLAPVFAGGTTVYNLSVPSSTTSMTVTPTTADGNATVKVNTVTVASGTASGSISLAIGTTVITTVVTAQNGTTTGTYTVTVNRPAPMLPTVASILPTTGSMAGGTSVMITGTNFTSPASVTIGGVAASNISVVNATTITATTPSAGTEGTASVVVTTAGGSNGANTLFTYFNPVITANYTSATYLPIPPTNGYTATGKTVNFSLSYAPVTGTTLTVVKNTGLQYIVDTFTGLPQGQIVPLTHNGVTYNFVANYYGGTGNDLVLVWAGTRVMAWGYNSNGQLGNGGVAQSLVPTNVTATGTLATKTVVATAVGTAHSLALCVDGSLFAWGYNGNGALGDDTFAERRLPVNITNMGALSGKTVIAIAAGNQHSLALCSDGTLATWGDNGAGQLGNGDNALRKVPVAITNAGALLNKTVIAIAAGESHSLALCSDGSVAAWGQNSNGQLGIGNNNNPNYTPVAVNTGALANKTVTSIAAGYVHSLALCSDGTVAAWGWGGNGQLGNNNIADQPTPVNITSSGALSGRTVVALSGGYAHSVALFDDGSMAAWGYNAYGQLGDGTNAAERRTPVLVLVAGSALVGRTAIGITSGQHHSVALCSDGNVVAWGFNTNGQVGNADTAHRSLAALVSTTPLAAGDRFIGAVSGATAYHNVSLVAAAVSNPNILLSANGIAENLPANSTVGTLSNVDSGTGITYALTVTGGVDNAAFTITGNVLSIKAPADFETKSTYSIRVSSTDGVGVVIDKNFTINVVDVNDMPSFTKGSDQLHDIGTNTVQTVTNWASSINDGDSAVSQTLTFLVSVTSGSGLFTTAPAITSDGTLTYTPTGALGTATVSVMLRDDASFGVSTALTSAAQTFTITIQGVVATVTTPNVTNVTATSAILGGNVTSAGGLTIIERGVVYAPSFLGGNPQLDNGADHIASSTNTTGVFTVNANNLQPGTQYSFAAYASNSRGVAYSEVSTFTAPSNNADLSGLMLVDFTGPLGTNNGGGLGVLTPNFSSGTTSYTAQNLPNWVESIKVNCLIAQANATVKVNGVTVNGVSTFSGAVSSPVSLNVGPNTITIICKAEDGVTTKTYTISVTRIARPTVTSPTVANVTTNSATLGGNISNTGYDFLTDSGIVYAPTATNNNPQLLGTGVIKVQGGIPAVFTLPIGGLTQGVQYSFAAYATNSEGTSYSPVAIFSTLSNNANLSTLSFSAGTVTYTPAIFNYDVTVPGATTSITLTPTAAQANATVRVNNVIVPSGLPSAPITLNPTSTSITVNVLAQDGSTSQNYSVVVLRLSVPTLSTPTSSFVTADSAHLEGNATSNGGATISAHGIVFAATATNNTPRILGTGVIQLMDFNTLSSGISTFASGLTAGTSYSFATYATNSEGTAYSSTATFTTLGQEIVVTGNAVSITDGDITPALADHTDFGSVANAGGTVMRTFTVQNTGSATLTLGTLTLGGTHVANFSLTTAPAASVAPGSSTSFQITFDPSALGLRTATVSLPTNDADENPFNFSIQGTGLNSVPTDIALSGNSIAENNAANAVIGTLSATDLDAGSSHIFSLVTGTGSTDNTAFTVTGNVLTINASANYEAKPSYSIRVQADDGNGGIFAKALPITITNVNELPVVATADVGTGPPTFTTLFSFTGATGSYPGTAPYFSRLVQDTDDTFYGTTSGGGANSLGTVFKMTPAGVRTTLVDFTGTTGAKLGSSPYGSLVKGPDGSFYGMTQNGGANSFGTVFKVTTTGEFNTVLEFTGNTGTKLGASPQGDLLLSSDGNFYGMTSGGGVFGYGTVFKMTPAGGLTTLVQFTGSSGANLGGSPTGSLVKGSDGNFYGATQSGGANNKGTVFRMTSVGALNTLFEFTGTTGANPGSFPKGSLVQGSDGNFYGTTQTGGTGDLGTVFKVTPVGERTTVVEFTGVSGANPGSSPQGSLILASDGSFYGMASSGGTNNRGTIFKITAGALTTLIHFSGFSAPALGMTPLGSLTQGSDGILYGMTFGGGPTNQGTVFKLAPPLPVTTAAEGSLATYTGTFSDPDGNATVNLTASSGAVVKDNVAGTWSWSSTGTDGLASSIITITATDDATATATARFTFSVTNLPPSFDLGANTSLTAGSGVLTRTVSFTDPGADVWSGTVNYGDGSGNQALSVNQGAKTFALSRTYAASGTYTVSVTLNDDDSGTLTDTYAVTVSLIPPVSEIVVLGNATSITDGDATPSLADFTDFGSIPVASSTVVRSFTIQNTGTGPLTLGTLILGGTHSADFSLTTAPAVSVSAGGSTSFQITFDPSAAVLRTATLSFTNNDSDESPFNFSIQGIGYTATEVTVVAWAESQGLSGPAAAPSATPFNDGVPNLLKNAFNMPLTGPNVSGLTPGSGTSGLPAITAPNTGGPPASIRIEYIRRIGSGLIYTPLYSLNDLSHFTPMTATPTVTPIDANWERVVVNQLLGLPLPKTTFSRVSVTAP